MCYPFDNRNRKMETQSNKCKVSHFEMNGEISTMTRRWRREFREKVLKKYSQRRLTWCEKSDPETKNALRTRLSCQQQLATVEDSVKTKIIEQKLNKKSENIFYLFPEVLFIQVFNWSTTNDLFQIDPVHVCFVWLLLSAAG